MDNIEKERKIIIDSHRNNVTPYYDNAEKKEWMDVFWSDNSDFRKMFNKLDTRRILELACGHGRHVPKYVSASEKVILVDVLQENLDYCKNRFIKGLSIEDSEKIHYFKCNGKDLVGIPDESCTAVFSYDAMVHFELMDIYSYLIDCYRILEYGGKCLFHHSNYHDNYKIRFENSVHYRNYMSADIFAYLCDRVGFNVIEQKIIDWELGGAYVEKLDCITMIEKVR